MNEADKFYVATALTRGLLVFFSGLILYRILAAIGGKQPFIRRIPGLAAIDEAVGRATEMGKPITFSIGLGGLDIVTLQALAVAIHVVRMCARFGNRVIVTMMDATMYAVASEAIQEAYTEEGRPEAFNEDDVRFLSDQQFAYASAMVGIIQREQVASNFMFGVFYAESLILAEAGNQVGAIQVAGTPVTTQIPFFVAACDYTIIGDEFYAATAYLTREPVLTGSLVGQDYGKMALLGAILLLTAAASITAWVTYGAPPGAENWVDMLRGIIQAGAR